MNNETLTKVTAKRAVDICNQLALEDEAKSLLDADTTPRQFLDLLVEKELFPDAVRFLAHGLPKREGVWWAVSCTRLTAGTNLSPYQSGKLQAAEKWVKDPNENNRRAAMPAGDDPQFKHPSELAALAAFWSGGSLGPPDVPEIPPGEFLTAKGVSGAVMLAAVMKEPENAKEKYTQFLSLGIEVANGKNRWI